MRDHMLQFLAANKVFQNNRRAEFDAYLTEENSQKLSDLFLELCLKPKVSSEMLLAFGKTISRLSGGVLTQKRSMVTACRLMGHHDFESFKRHLDTSFFAPNLRANEPDEIRRMISEGCKVPKALDHMERMRALTSAALLRKNPKVSESYYKKNELVAAHFYLLYTPYVADSDELLPALYLSQIKPGDQFEWSSDFTQALKLTDQEALKSMVSKIVERDVDGVEDPSVAIPKALLRICQLSLTPVLNNTLYDLSLS
jgi:hypothetical protein